MKKIAAVVVTYNRVELLKECIKSLKNQTVKLECIIIINNASTDGTSKYLESIKNNSLHVYHMDKNLGGAGGFHYGLKSSVELGFDYSWIMDDDAIPASDALEKLYNAGNNINWQFGFLTSNVQNTDEETMNVPPINLTPNSGGYPDWGKFAQFGLIKISMATFVSVLIPNSIIAAVGLPVKEMFIWGDDSEYTQRISNIKESYFVGDSIVKHKRVSNNNLSIISEDNLVRLKWYIGLYRNNGYRIKKHENKTAYLKYFKTSMTTILKVILKAKHQKLLRCRYILTGTLKSISFNPKIIFPKK